MSHFCRLPSDVMMNAPLRVPTRTRTPLIPHSLPGVERRQAPPQRPERRGRFEGRQLGPAGARNRSPTDPPSRRAPAALATNSTRRASDGVTLGNREEAMGPENSEVLRGTLDMLILKTLHRAPLHGWGICERIQQASEDALRVRQGSLYAAP